MLGLPWGGGRSRAIKGFSLWQVEPSGTSTVVGEATVYLSDFTPHLKAGQGTQPGRACEARSWGGCLQPSTSGWIWVLLLPVWDLDLQSQPLPRTTVDVGLSLPDLLPPKVLEVIEMSVPHPIQYPEIIFLGKIIFR